MARYSTDKEVFILKKYASFSNFGIVEIGVLDGETTREIATSSKVPIYGIDPIIPDSMDEKLIGNEKNILNNLSFYKDFIFYKDFSFNVVKNFKHKFDLIFIDGSHIYEDVKRDFIDWFPLLEREGFICFHDSAPIINSFQGWPGPIKLVKELKDNNSMIFIEVIDTLSIFKKL